ncbi:hypothetical protein LINPERPRIM_LOCUS24814 [Linum perenne]
MTENSAVSKGKQKSRDYTAWTPELDVALIRAMLQLVEKKEVESGNFQNGGFKKIEILMKTFIPSCSMKRFRGAKGLNKSPFPYYDQLAQIFGLDRAVGGESESPADVDVPNVPVAVNDASKQFMDAPFAFDNEASQRVLECLINQVNDGRNMAVATSIASASTRTSKRPRKHVLASGMTDEIAKLHPLLEKTASSIERMVNSICHDDDVQFRRGNLYTELASMDGLSHDQVVAATLALMKDDRAS